MSLDFSSHLILLAALLFLVSILATVLTPRLGVPLLLIFLLVGMLAGEDGPGGIHFNNYPLANLAATAALAVVLFDGGMRTPLHSFRTGLRPALMLASFGVLITAGATALFCTWLLKLSPAEGFLIGAIVASTDAAAVFSLLGGSALSLNERVASALEIESGTNDPMAIFLTLATITYLQMPDSFGIWDALRLLFWQMSAGAVLGVGGGWLLVRGLNRLRLGDSMVPLLALFGGLAIFGLTALAGGSGFLAVYLAGIFLGNRALRGAATIRRFHDGMAWMAQIGMFVILGLLVSPRQLEGVMLPGLVLSAVLILVARPAAVFLSLAPFKFPWREQLYIAWVGLRGSVPIVLATYPWLAGLPNAQLFFNMAFFIVLVSLVVQGWTVAPLARLLGLQVPATSARIHRDDIDLPGQQGYEVVSYRLPSNSKLIGVRPKQLPIPDVSRVICVARRGRVLHYRDWGELQAGDYISLLAAQTQLDALDRVFEAVHGESETTARRYFGEFTVRADVLLADLCEAYGLRQPEHRPGKTIAELLQKHLPHPVVGDRLRLGDIQLVVKEVQGDRPTLIGLRLPH
ncbi:cell volume regulation protein A [Solimonas aquatica]|uniref:Cell volume regulation protein A n=1 Tax=Solimonas aquatica TaxID=489703 RepID=A0A1H9GT88_9GAMM|nr:potassium/proton antiporter [Solimonas aquatica]SEQ53274.1 cell volume regulation protein A [Solimonas aquatica]